MGAAHWPKPYGWKHAWLGPWRPRPCAEKAGFHVIHPRFFFVAGFKAKKNRARISKSKGRLWGKSRGENFDALNRRGNRSSPTPGRKKKNSLAQGEAGLSRWGYLRLEVVRHKCGNGGIGSRRKQKTSGAVKSQ